MAVLNDGKIVFNGSPESLVESARDKVWRVIASDYELDELKQNFPVISTVPSERGWEVRLVGSDVPGHQVEPVEPNLEDAYICFMQEFCDDGNVLAEHDSW
jgi:ABC-type multidrug transport system ATPase subunit